jgi:hypothetical protein
VEGVHLSPVASSYEHSNASSDSIKGKKCLSEISGSHGGEYEDGCLLGCFAV